MVRLQPPEASFDVVRYRVGRPRVHAGSILAALGRENIFAATPGYGIADQLLAYPVERRGVEEIDSRIERRVQQIRRPALYIARQVAYPCKSNSDWAD